MPLAACGVFIVLLLARRLVAWRRLDDGIRDGVDGWWHGMASRLLQLHPILRLSTCALVMRVLDQLYQSWSSVFVLSEAEFAH